MIGNGTNITDNALEQSQLKRSAGDFDVNGLHMAVSLRKRYGDAWVAWHMDAETYQSASDEKQPKLVDREVVLLKNLEVDWDDELIPMMTRVRRKVFQEHIVSNLLSDFV